MTLPSGSAPGAVVLLFDVRASKPKAGPAHGGGRLRPTVPTLATSKPPPRRQTAVVIAIVVLIAFTDKVTPKPIVVLLASPR
jgi:hypothetical protein